MNTCKECEHYEFYDGPEKLPSGDKIVMFCPNRQKAVGYGHFANIIKCTGFTPKKPEEKTCKECENADKPGWKFHCEQWRKGDDLSHEACKCSFTPKKPVEKSCKTCGARMENNGTDKSCSVFLNVPIGNCKGHSLWQPIKPVEKKCKACRRSRYWPTGDDSCEIEKCPEGYGGFLPIKPDKPKAEVPETDVKMPSPEQLTEIVELTDKLLTSKKKEKTMSKIKKRIRKYVMACTLYCTAVICIALNPWLFKLAGIIKENWGLEDGEYEWIYKDGECLGRELVYEIIPWNSGDVKQIAFVWCCVLVSIVTILIAIYAYNKAIDYVFSKLEK